MKEVYIVLCNDYDLFLYGGNKVVFVTQNLEKAKKAMKEKITTHANLIGFEENSYNIEESEFEITYTHKEYDYKWITFNIEKHIIQ